MEEAKAAAYYDELTRKGEGAARFKQGLGFSSSSSFKSDSFAPPKAPSSAAAAPSSSFYSNFVRAASPGRAAEIQKQVQIEKIQSKLKKNRHIPSPAPDRSSDADGSGLLRSGEHRHRHHSRSPHRRSRDRDRSRSRERDGDRESRNRHRSRSRGRGDVGKDRSRRRRRSRSRSASEEEGKIDGIRRSRHGQQEVYHHHRARRSRSRSPPPSPKPGSLGRSHRDSHSRKLAENSNREMDGRPCDSIKDKVSGSDYSQLIDGYSQMTPAERVKAKMKLQLSQTAAKDMAKGISTGWERFDFNKEAPLDDDEEIEVADDEGSLVKDIGRSFRFSAVEAKREEAIKAAHDQAMFGTSASLPAPPEKESTEENVTANGTENHLNNALISDKVFAMKQGSWRDRARKLQNGSRN